MKFRHSIRRSHLSVAIVVLFTVVYFIDAANLDDLVPGITVIHTDTNETSGSSVAVGFDSAVAQPHTSSPFTAAATNSGKPRSLRLVIDQDSPSFAAEPLIAAMSSDLLAGKEQLPVISYCSSASLYLLNHSLLI